MAKPELASLRHSLKPAFLWDPTRRRIVWANAAALHWFGARSLSELVERPFDAREAGVRTLTQLAEAAMENKDMQARLSFPSSGREEPLSAVVRLYPLGDGQPGLLICGKDTNVRQAPVLAEILNEMPQPVLALTPAGEPVYVNAATQELLGPQVASDVRRLFPSSLALRTFLLRALEAGTAVEVRDIDTRMGLRTLRLTARTSRQGDLIVVTIDDLTDRLQAERLEGMPAGPAPETYEEPEEPPADEEEQTPGTGLAPEELAALRRMMEAMEAEAADTETMKAGAAAEATEPDTEAGEKAAEQDAPVAAAPQAGSETAVQAVENAGTAPEPDDPAVRPRARISIRRRPADGMATENTERPPATEADLTPPTPTPDSVAGTTDQIAGAVPETDQAGRPEEPEEDVSGQAASPVAEAQEVPAPAATAEAAETAAAPEEQEGGDENRAVAAPPPQAGAEETAEENEEDEGGEGDEEEKERPEPPALVREVLDHRPEPIILHRSEAFYFANKAAIEHFGHPLQDRAWDELAQRLSASKEGEKITLPDASGREHLFRLKRDVFPWRAGVVVQSTLEPLKTDSGRQSAADGHDHEGETGNVRAVPPVPAMEKPRPGTTPGQAGGIAEKRAPAPVIRIQTERPKPDLAMVGGGGVAAPHALPANEEPWKYIRENAVDGLLLLDGAGHILELDSGAQRLLQVTEAEAKGRPLRAFMQGDSATALDVWIASLKQDAKGKAARREMLLKTPRGDTVPVRLLLGRVRSTGVQKTAFCAALCDISEWKRREEELIRAREKAEAESARKSTFLASISHELRTPLNAILGFAEVLRQEMYGPLGNEKYRDYARDIHESGKHLLALVNDLLDMARVEAGRLQVNFTEVDLAEVVESAVKLLRDRIAASGIDLVRVTPDDLPKVVADRRSMKQILLNLLSNAIAYGRRGSKVVVALKLREKGGLELSVKDTGPGMTREELEAALQPYRRVPRTGGEDTRGTGLGLPLAKALTQANKAAFEIESAPEKGTEVRIIFPPHRVLS